MATFDMETQQDFHDTYLYTDMSLADLMEAHRTAFFQHLGIDPVQFVTNASASWAAMLRRCVPSPQNPLRVVADERIYRLVREGLKGGLSCMQQPRGRANHPSLAEYGFWDPEQRVSWIKMFDVASLYPHIMTLPLPVDEGTWLPLPATTQERLDWLQRKLKGVCFDYPEYRQSYLLEVTFDVPLRHHKHVDWAPVCRLHSAGD